MMKRHKKALTRATLGGVAVVASLALLSPTAGAQEERDRARFDDGPTYPIEIEPHFAFGAENVYGASGFGAGLRVSIPLIAGHLGRVPDNLAIQNAAFTMRLGYPTITLGVSFL